MSLATMRAFERLLASGAPEAQIDEFLAALKNPDKGSHEERLVYHFSKNGVLRNQVGFLTALHSQGGVVDRREGSRIAFVFFSGVIDYIGVAGVRSRLSRMKANGIYL